SNIDLQQKAVELRFRQRIGAFLLQRILGRQHVEGARQVVTLSGESDVALLHRLQQSRLCARRGAVDFVGHQKLAEHGTLDEPESPPAMLVFLEYFGTHDVARHQVGRELDAFGVHSQHGAERVDEAGLRQSGYANQEAVAACQKRDQNLIYDCLLTEDKTRDRLTGGAELCAELV